VETIAAFAARIPSLPQIGEDFVERTGMRVSDMLGEVQCSTFSDEEEARA
jgi:hypothetical protein